MNDPVVDVQHLIKTYRKGRVNAVDDISFSVGSGEFLALLGPNGAGKTTTISILTTTLAPTSGDVRIGGHDLRHQPAAVRKQIGVIFQNPSLDMNLSGEENVRLHAIMYGLYPYRPSFRLMPRAYRDQVAGMAAVLAMEASLTQPVRKLSGGMRRKLEIIRGLMHRPRVLFLDEPTAGLDASSRRSLWEYLTEARRRDGTTVILTTHYLEEAETADRILILNHGRVIAEDAPEHIKARTAGSTLEIDADDRAALRDELAHQAAPFTESGHFVVHVEGSGAAQLVRELTTPLTMMRTRQTSLEDVYLRILADD